jgi:Ferritin-like domain
MTTIDVRTLLHAPHWEEDSALETILDSLLRRRPMALPATPPDPAEIWTASSFRLDRVTEFIEAPEERQREIIRRCAADRLAEALYVEKLGLAFCAKMTLLAETAEERMLYALTAGDEATHYHWISRFVGDDPVPSPFLDLISSWIERGSRGALTLLVQVVLEGWGVQHYRILGRDCRDAELAAVLREIVTDEARHHRSGTRLLGQRALTDADRAEITSALARLLDIVRVGPQAIVAAIDPVDRVRCFAELQGTEDARRNLELLRDLIGDAAIVAALDFTPMTAEECARCSIS